MPSEIATIITGRPNHKEKKEIKHFTAWQHQIWRSQSMVTVTSACLKKIKKTPWDDMIHVHLGVYIVNFHNEEVEINSLDQHPTESGHQEILHQSCYCNTGSLWKERVFEYFLSAPFDKIFTVQRVSPFYRQKKRPLTLFSVALVPARKMICPAPSDTETLSRIWERGWQTSLMK